MGILDGTGSAAAIDEYRRREARRLVGGVNLPRQPGEDGFAAFIRRSNRTLWDHQHVRTMADVAQRIVAGQLQHVLVMMPPRYWKSEVFSRLLPAYFLEERPLAWVGLSSYGADLAWSLSEEARTYYQRDGGQLRRESSAKRRWRTHVGGGMWAAGVGGPLLGFGMHLGIVDDPTDPEKAHSPTYQRRFRTWWAEKWLSRREPGAALVVVMQRLGPEDPVDFLLRREVGDEVDLAPMRWHVVVLDEVHSGEKLGEYNGPRGLPPTCTLEPDWRKPGEVLAPGRFKPSEVQQAQVSAGPYATAAQRQQRPSAPTGDFWRQDWFINVYDELPADAFNGGWDWDLAYTDKETNSASAGVQSFRGPGPAEAFPIYVHSCDWDWLEFPELLAFMRAKGGPHHIEQKASGKSAAQTLRRERIPCTEVRVDGDKLARASAVQPVAAQGRVWVQRRTLHRLLNGDRQGLLRVRSEQLAADQGDLDLNDAFVQALHRHTGLRRRPGVYYPGMKVPQPAPVPA